MDEFRFYAFVPALYISPLQCGLQTAHAVSEMYIDTIGQEKQMVAFHDWASYSKTIVILDAMNHKGVREAYDNLYPYAEKFHLPITIFHEDEDSLNNAATCTGILVPERFYAAKYIKPFEMANDTEQYVYSQMNPEGTAAVSITIYDAFSAEFALCNLIKSYRKA